MADNIGLTYLTCAIHQQNLGYELDVILYTKA